jgi:hypothetical protein
MISVKPISSKLCDNASRGGIPLIQSILGMVTDLASGAKDPHPSELVSHGERSRRHVTTVARSLGVVGRYQATQSIMLGLRSPQVLKLTINALFALGEAMGYTI